MGCVSSRPRTGAQKLPLRGGASAQLLPPSRAEQQEPTSEAGVEGAPGPNAIHSASTALCGAELQPERVKDKAVNAQAFNVADVSAGLESSTGDKLPADALVAGDAAHAPNQASPPLKPPQPRPPLTNASDGRSSHSGSDSSEPAPSAAPRAQAPASHSREAHSQEALRASTTTSTANDGPADPWARLEQRYGGNRGPGEVASSTASPTTKKTLSKQVQQAFREEVLVLDEDGEVETFYGGQAQGRKGKPQNQLQSAPGPPVRAQWSDGVLAQAGDLMASRIEDAGDSERGREVLQCLKADIAINNRRSAFVDDLQVADIDPDDELFNEELQYMNDTLHTDFAKAAGAVW